MTLSHAEETKLLDEVFPGAKVYSVVERCEDYELIENTNTEEFSVWVEVARFFDNPDAILEKMFLLLQKTEDATRDGHQYLLDKDDMTIRIRIWGKTFDMYRVRKVFMSD